MEVPVAIEPWWLGWMSVAERVVMAQRVLALDWPAA